jgi:hypothetical protein
VKAEAVVATVSVTVRQMNFSPALRIKHAGQKAHLGDDLKAVADAQDVAALRAWPRTAAEIGDCAAMAPQRR